MHQTARYPGGRATSLWDGHAESDTFHSLGIVNCDKTKAVSIRLLSDSSNAKAAAIAVRGSDASIAKHRYRMAGIEPTCATRR